MHPVGDLALARARTLRSSGLTCDCGPVWGKDGIFVWEMRWEADKGDLLFFFLEAFGKWKFNFLLIFFPLFFFCCIGCRMGRKVEL